MSIADKLTYLQTTKQLLKTEINKINNVLDDNSTFRSYPEELFNGYLDILNNGTDTLWSNLEKVSQTGTEAVLEGVETAPIKMVLNGNTSQDILPNDYQQVEYITSDGNSWLDTNLYLGNNFNLKLEFIHNQQSSNEQPIVSIWQSQYNYWNLFIDRFNILDLYVKGHYFAPDRPTLKIGEKYFGEVSRDGNNFKLILNNMANSFTVTDLTDNPTSLKIFNRGDLAGNSYVSIGHVQIYKDNVLVLNLIPCYKKTDNKIGMYDLVNNVFYTNQGTGSFAKGNDIQNPDYPSPEYPQQVKVVKGENVVSVQGKNLLNMNYLVEANADKTYVSQGFWAFKLSDKIGTYTLSRENANMVSGGSYIAWGEGNDITTAYNRKTWIAHQSQSNLNNKKQTKTNSGELWLFLSTNETRIQNIPNDYGYLMLEQGSTATDFVPYSKTDYPINLGDIELCKINTYKDYFHKDSGKWYVQKEIGKYQITGQESSSVFYWSNEARGMRLILDDAIKTTANAPLYCNRFKLVRSASTDANYVRLNRTTGVNYTGVWFGNISITGVSDATTFKTYAMSNDIILYYPLATPTETEITNTTLIEQLEAISNAKSVKDKTYITQTNDELPFILDIEAIKEYSVE